MSDEPRYRVSVLADAEAIAIAEVASDGGGLAPPPHVHRRHVESFSVLDGELTLTAGGRELRVGAGSWVQIPAGAPHAFEFPDDGRVRFLDVHTPSCGFGAFVRRLHEAPTDEERAAARAAFDQESA